MDQAQADGVVVPIAYDARYTAIRIKEQYERLFSDTDFEEATIDKQVEGSLNSVLGATERVNNIARDIVGHFKKRAEYEEAAKAIVVVSTRKNAQKMYNAMKKAPGCPKIDVVLSSYEDLDIKKRNVKSIEREFKKRKRRLKNCYCM